MYYTDLKFHFFLPVLRGGEVSGGDNQKRKSVQDLQGAQADDPRQDRTSAGGVPATQPRQVAGGRQNR